MIVLGLALGAAQLIPLYELVSQSFREGAASLQQVRDWAWPTRQIITFLLPDFFGNPTAHSYFDIWQRAWVPVTQNALGEPLNTIDWGVKNYVEGGNYLGLLTWLLAGVAVVDALLRRWRRGRGAEEQEEWRRGGDAGLAGHRCFCASTAQRPRSVRRPGGAVAALRLRHAALCGALLSAARLQPAPLGVSLGVPLHAEHGGAGGVWAGRGGGRWQGGKVAKLHTGESADRLRFAPCNLQRLPRVLGWLAVLAGAAALLVVLVSVFVPGPFVALGDRLLAWSDLARTRGFADGAMAWSYEAVGIARLGLMAVLAGVALVWATRKQGDKETRRQGDGERHAASPRPLVYSSAYLPVALHRPPHPRPLAVRPRLQLGGRSEAARLQAAGGAVAAGAARTRPSRGG